MTSSASPSPLDLIRQAERECAQQIRDAQAEADERTLAARKRASALKQEAVALGRQQGEQDYREAMAAAEREAQQILEQARDHASGLLQDSATTIEAMVDEALAILLSRGEP